MGYGLDGQVRFLAGAIYFSLLYSLQTDPGDHTTFYAVGTRGKMARS
jgi:hypothetical protein